MKLFYSDIDDTLYSSKGYTKEIDDMIIKINSKEDKFIPCSGRPLINLKKEFKNVDYLIPFNGAIIYDVKNDKNIFENILNKDEVQKITDYLETIKIDYIIYDQNELLSNNKENKYAKEEEKICGFKVNKKVEIISSPKVLALVEPNISLNLMKNIKKKFPNLEVSISKPFFLEITKKNVNKGVALTYLQNLLNVENKNTYCFGDGLNDMSMFELKINKIAVANAHELILKKADKITDSCTNNGVIKYIIKEYDEKL